MIVNARFFCREIVGNARAGAYEVAKPMNVASFMEYAAAENGTFLANYQDYLIYLVNGTRAMPETQLCDGDTLTVLRMVIGG